MLPSVNREGHWYPFGPTVPSSVSAISTLLNRTAGFDSLDPGVNLNRISHPEPASVPEIPQPIAAPCLTSRGTFAGIIQNRGVRNNLPETGTAFSSSSGRFLPSYSKSQHGLFALLNLRAEPAPSTSFSLDNPGWSDCGSSVCRLRSPLHPVQCLYLIKIIDIGSIVAHRRHCRPSIPLFLSVAVIALHACRSDFTVPL